MCKKRSISECENEVLQRIRIHAVRANVPQRCAWQTDFFYFMKNSGCRRSMQKYILTHSRLSRRGNLSELLSIRKGPGLNFWYHSTTSRAGSGARVSGGGTKVGSGMCETGLWFTASKALHWCALLSLFSFQTFRLVRRDRWCKSHVRAEQKSRANVLPRTGGDIFWSSTQLCADVGKSHWLVTHTVCSRDLQLNLNKGRQQRAMPAPPPPPHTHTHTLPSPLSHPSQNRWTAPVIAANVARTSTVALAKNFVAANCKCALGDEYSTSAAAETVWYGGFAATKTVWHGSFAATKSIWQRH